FLIGDLLQPSRLCFDARVGRIDTVDIRIDVATVGADGGGNRDCAGIRAAAAEGRQAVVGANPLETGDDGDLPLGQPFDQPLALDILDARRAVAAVGANRDLPALPRTGIDGDVLQRN